MGSYRPMNIALGSQALIYRLYLSVYQICIPMREKIICLYLKDWGKNLSHYNIRELDLLSFNLRYTAVIKAATWANQI